MRLDLGNFITKFISDEGYRTKITSIYFEDIYPGLVMFDEQAKEYFSKGKDKCSD